MMRNQGVHTGSINSHRDFLIANSGLQNDGCMSPSRRFFCNFTLFQFIFVSFIWILYPMVQGANVKDIIKHEVLEYTIQTSLFDVAVLSFLRFVLLLIVYGKLNYSHTWVVATTCALTCCFLIAKIFLFEWPKGESHPFQVMLVLVAFIACWVEIWFMDFKVLPQERKEKRLAELANQSFEGVLVQNDNEENIDRIREFLSVQTESVANFYSPMESPQGSENGDYSPPSMKPLTAEEAEMVLSAENAVKRALDTIDSPGWSEESRIDADVVYSKMGPKGYRIYKLEAVVDLTAEKMYIDCINNIESVPTWNRNIALVQRVKKLGATADLVYQVSASPAGNVVQSRDFITVRHWQKNNESWVVGGISVPHKDHPPVKEYVRGENGPNCLVFTPHPFSYDKCRFQWLLDVNLKGWIPRRVLHKALVSVVCEFIEQLKTHIEDVHQKR